jgi:hypothetical protein
MGAKMQDAVAVMAVALAILMLGATLVAPPAALLVRGDPPTYTDAG